MDFHRKTHFKSKRWLIIPVTSVCFTASVEPFKPFNFMYWLNFHIEPHFKLKRCLSLSVMSVCVTAQDGHNKVRAELRR